MNRQLLAWARKSGWDRAAGLAAGMLIGLSIWTPVFAASADQPQDWLTWGIIGAVALLAVGVALKAVASKRSQPYHLPRDMRLDVRSASGEVVNTGGD